MKRFATLFVLILFMATFVQAGIQWTAKIVTEDQKGNSEEMMTVTSAQDGNFRQEFSNVSKRQRDQYVEDGYWLYKSKEGMLYIVNHKEKTVTPMSLEALQQVLQALGPIVRMELEDVNVKIEPLGTATILGYPCTHARIDRSYTMKMKVTIIKKTMRMEEEMEVWGSTAVPAYKSLQGEFIHRGFKTGWEDLDNMIQKQMASMKDLGFPLKTVTRTRQYGKKGKLQSETLTTMEVEKLEQKSFPDNFFSVPQDYKVVENQMMSAGDVEEEGEEEGEEEEKGKKKKKFKLQF